MTLSDDIIKKMITYSFSNEQEVLIFNTVNPAAEFSVLAAATKSSPIDISVIPMDFEDITEYLMNQFPPSVQSS